MGPGDSGRNTLSGLLDRRRDIGRGNLPRSGGAAQHTTNIRHPDAVGSQYSHQLVLLRRNRHKSFWHEPIHVLSLVFYGRLRRKNRNLGGCLTNDGNNKEIEYRKVSRITLESNMSWFVNYQDDLSKTLLLFAQKRMPPIPVVGGLASLGFHKVDEINAGGSDISL
jgi:hypothetical protein